MNIPIKYIISTIAFLYISVDYLFFYSSDPSVSYSIAPMLAMGLASSAIKGVTGIAQMLRGRPDEVRYEIPDEVAQSLDISRRRARGEVRSFGTMRENLESQTAAMARRATELGGAGAGVLSKLQANQMAGTRDIDMAEENYQIQAERAYQQELQNVAQYKTRQFDVNELQPNERLWNEYYNSKVAGSQNLMGSMDNIATLAGTAMGQKGIDEELGKALGEEKTPLFGDIPEGGEEGDYTFSEDPMYDFKDTLTDPWASPQYGSA